MSASELGDVLWNPPAAAIGVRNAIVSEAGPKRLEAFPGTLSIKHMLSGWAVWEAGGRRFRVEGDAFLVLNHGTVYSLERRAGEPAQSFCPFFAPGFVEAAERAATASQEALLDEPDRPRAMRFELHEQLHIGSAVEVARLRALAHAIRGGVATPLFVDEQFAALALSLVTTRDRIALERARAPAARPSTRAELHARVQRARDRMHDGLGSRLTLAELGRAAGLSPHHLHRAFRAIHGESPHRYLTRLRLERARRLLRATDRSVTEICAALGFESLGSFSALFRREVGTSPSAWRSGAREIPKIREADTGARDVGFGA